MTLFSLAKKNIIGNFKSYLIYFLSMIFSVVIYFTFVSFQYSSEVQQGIESSASLLNIFVAASVILILFVAVFISYSNSFFTKKRKKEVGLYSLLGLRKKTISRMLFYENLIMSGIAVVLGIVMGLILSKLFTMILLKLLDSAVTVSFGISLEAVINTMIVFTIIILYTSVRAHRLIYRFKLIELFRADKEGEQAPKASNIGAGLAVVLLVAGYWFAWQPLVSNAQMLRNFGIFLFCLILGTYLLFRFLTLFLSKQAQKRKSSYYRGINLISASQLMYRIKGNARTLTIIALLSGLTLSALSVGYSFYHTNELHAHKEATFSYMHLSKDDSYNEEVNRIITQDSEHLIIAQMEVPILYVEGKTTSPLLEDYLEGGPIKLIAESTYNQVSEALNRDVSMELSGNQAVGIQPLYTNYSPNDYSGYTVMMSLPEGQEKLEFMTMTEERVIPWSYPDMSIIVSDPMFEDISKQIKPITYIAYEVEDEKRTKETSGKLHNLDNDELQISTFYAVYRAGLESAGLNIFVLGFLGLVFLAATGSIIYFKQLTEAHEDKGRYEILQKMGVSKKEVKTTVRKQTLFVFGLPLVVGVLHSVVILELASNLFSVLIGMNLIVPITISMGAYIVIYLGYYVLTLNSVNNIVNK